MSLSEREKREIFGRADMAREKRLKAQAAGNTKEARHFDEQEREVLKELDPEGHEAEKRLENIDYDLADSYREKAQQALRQGDHKTALKYDQAEYETLNGFEANDL